MRASVIYVQDVIPGLDVGGTETCVLTEPETIRQPVRPASRGYVQPDFQSVLDETACGERTSGSPSYADNPAMLREYMATADPARKVWLRNRLIEANQGLVTSVVARFAEGSDSLRALISEGQIALLSAIAKCEPDRVELFAAYAASKIRAAAIEYLRVNRHRILQKQHAVARLNMIRRAVIELADRKSLPVDEIGVCAEQFSDEEIARQAKLFPGTVTTLRPFIAAAVEMDKPMGDDSDAPTVGEAIAAESASPADLVADNDERDGRLTDMQIALNSLKPQHANVVRMYYGIGCEARNQPQIAEQIGVSQQRITFILRQSLDALRIEMARASSLRRVAAKGRTLRHIG